jgi:hypothetical protein
MASTDTRSGFRLPWSSDRSHDEAAPASDTTETPADEAAPAAGAAWPEANQDAPAGPAQPEQHTAAENESPAAAPEEPEPMVDMDTAVVTATAAAPKKPSKLMADLTAAIRSTAEAAREQSLAQVENDVKVVVEQIRERSTEGATALKHQSEEDIAAIREWSKAEIARIREETESRIATRKSTLEEELAGHAAAVERRVEEVQVEVTRFEAAMGASLDRLGEENDPASLATMAEEMPEPPSFEAWADLDTLDISVAAAPVVEAFADSSATSETEAVAAPDETVDERIDEEAVAEHVDAVFADFAAAAAQPVEAPVADPDPVAEAAGEDDAHAIADATPAADPWTSETAWGKPAVAAQEAVTGDDASRWGTGESPDGADAVDRGAIMAALEAAAEAVVAAEAAAESADQAEAAADVAESAAGLLVGRSAPEGESDPEAAGAMSADTEAGGFETESFADRLASLLPNHGEGSVGDEPRTTQVVVSGLVSVASIASFKRHLGRLAGVQNVAVASGPEGEFVFNLTHRADLSFRDAIPTMPGFAARVTNTGDGVVHVTARDPEAEA